MSWKVDVKVANSTVSGLGVFAAEAIKAGSIVWSVDRSMHFDRFADLLKLPAKTLSYALYAGYYHMPSGRFVWYEDGSQYINHADRPNIGIQQWTKLEDDHCMALRDIKEGEELFEDYRFWSVFNLYDDHWVRALSELYSPGHYEFLKSITLERDAA